MRRKLVQHGFGADRGFRWRGGEISRLVVSLEVPETFDELLKVLRGFFAFAVCFSILFWVWYDHYRMLFDQMLGVARDDAIRPGQMPTLMLVYGAGFLAVQLVFVLLYVRALRLADTMELDASERLATRSEVQSLGLNVVVGLASIAVVTGRAWPTC